MKSRFFCMRSLQRLFGILASGVFYFALPLNAQSVLRSLPTRNVPQAVLNGKAKVVGLLPATKAMRLDITLPLRNKAGLNRLLQQLYDPSSPYYRDFLTPKAFTERFAPTVGDYQAVVQWAKSKGFSVGKKPLNRLFVQVTGNVAQVDSAFHLIMHSYQRSNGNGTFFAPDREPMVDLNVPLWHIGGLSNHAVPHPLYAKGTGPTTDVGSGPGGSLLGSDRRAAYYSYGANPNTLLMGSGQTVGLFELGGYNMGDVDQYFSNVGQTLNVPINNVLIDGASASSDGDDTEQVIDIIDAVSMAPDLNQVLMFIGPQNGFLSGVTDTDIFTEIADDYSSVKQISVSWVWGTDYDADNQIFKEMAADGQSIFVASGDNNAWTAGQLAYPAEDPDVTAVGGTILTTSSADGPFSYAVAWGGGNSSCTNHEDGSGGGISPDDLPIPPYQQLSGVINSSNEGSTAYRNGPDVAAQADCVNYYCANGVCGDGLGGTSLAAPTWAGIAALANEAGSEYGTAPDGIGLVNETIYPLGLGSDYGNNFHDVVSGNNDTYSAVSGYDLVTGWGSPNVWNLVYSLSGAPQATKPVVDYVVTDGPSTCGNALAGYDNPCYLILSGTATVGSNEAMYIDGQQGSSPYSYSYTEDWGTGYCETINGYGYQCFGYAPFPTKTFYATESGYGNSVQVQSGQ